MVAAVHSCDRKNHVIERVEADNQFIYDQAGLDTLFLSSKTGDIVFRNGTDAISRAARMLNRKDTSYSHCGIIIREGDTAYVYHSIGGSENPSGRLLRQPLNDFCDTKSYSAFAIYRLQNRDRLQTLVTDVVHKHYRNRLKFDIYFNLESDNEMYCSEFVSKSMNEAFCNAGIEEYFLSLENKGVTIDDIYLNPFCKLVRKEVALIHTH